MPRHPLGDPRRGLIDPNAPAPVHAGLINLGGYARGVQVDAEPGSYTMVFGRRTFLRLGST